MPLYAYVCSCGNESDAFNRVSERHTNAPECHGRMEIKLSPNLGYVQQDCNYLCPVTRQGVTSNRQRQRIMAEHGLIDANDFPPKVAVEKAEAAKEARAKLAETVKHPVSDTELHKLLPVPA